MGEGYVLGADPEPIISFFARVGLLLEQKLLVYFSFCEMCGNALAAKFIC
jgi:hypothetical protein